MQVIKADIRRRPCHAEVPCLQADGSARLQQALLEPVENGFMYTIVIKLPWCTIGGCHHHNS